MNQKINKFLVSKKFLFSCELGKKRIRGIGQLFEKVFKKKMSAEKFEHPVFRRTKTEWKRSATDRGPVTCASMEIKVPSFDFEMIKKLI